MLEEILQGLQWIVKTSNDLIYGNGEQIGLVVVLILLAIVLWAIVEFQ